MAVQIFFSLQPDYPKQPRIEYPFYRFLYPMICGTISGPTYKGSGSLKKGSMIFGQYLTIQAIVWSHFYSFRAPHPSLVYSKATMYIHFFCIFPLYMTAFISIQPNEYRILYRCLHVTVLLIYFPPCEAPVKKCM